ncbi:hypothetical protein [Streptomyces sp. NPDC055287]
MNSWVLTAGITAAGVAAVHIIAGGRDVVRPLLAGDVPAEPRRVLHAVWHMVSVDLVLAAAALIWLSLADRPGGDAMAWLIAAHFVASAAFLVVTLAAGWSKPLLRLPQWMLLLPVAALAAVGAV